MTVEPPSDPADVGRELQRHRELRLRLEAAILPLATSLDGRGFVYHAPIASDLRVGGYAALETDGGTLLGQIATRSLEERQSPELELGGNPDDRTTAVRASTSVRMTTGTGVVLGGGASPFHNADLRPATSAEVDTLLGRLAPARAQLEIGETAVEGVPARLDAGGFSRHTFLCGQSGSGKTYALGVLLERLLLETRLRLLVFDLNSDFVGLGEVREGADPALAERFGEVAHKVRVLRSDNPAGSRLSLRFADLPAHVQAATLQLDPVGEPVEHARYLSLFAESLAGAAVGDLIARLETSEDPIDRRLGSRFRNLGLLDWSLWPRPGETPVLDELERDDWRALVVDLGTVERLEQRSLLAASILDRLWSRRTLREPLLVVVDEAHNLCPPRADNPLGALALDHLARIAAEGRKYGLYLLLSTQRPQQIHEQVLSQCDNLVLLRMNSSADLGRLEHVFSAVPSSFLEQATGFRQGEALVAGKHVPHPLFLDFGARITTEGGADVPLDWAAPL